MEATHIHETAIIDPTASVAESAQIGPYTVIGPGVVLGDHVQVMSHCHIEGNTTIGAGTKVFPNAVIGTPPQDKKYKDGDRVYLKIGKNNIFREHVMINPGTLDGGGTTQIGEGNLFMAYAHVAHDCSIGNHCVLANVATLAGHVTVEDYAVIGGLTAIHQFARIGKRAMVGGCSRVSQDVVPFAMCSGAETRVVGVNVVGLKRAGFSVDQIQTIKRVYKILFFSGLRRSHALERIEQDVKQTDEVRYLMEFVKASERGLMGGMQVKN